MSLMFSLITPFFPSFFENQLISSQLRQRRSEEESVESTTTAEELRRLYAAAGGEPTNNGHGPHIPTAHHRTPPGGGGSANATAFSTFFPHLANDRLFQIYQQSNAYQQPFPPSIPGLQASSMLQPSTSFQSLPSSRIPSPHHQFQQRQSPPLSQTYNRANSPGFPSPPPAHIKRSASVSSRQSREESASPIHQNSWSFEEQFKQVSGDFVSFCYSSCSTCLSA